MVKITKNSAIMEKLPAATTASRLSSGRFAQMRLHRDPSIWRASSPSSATSQFDGPGQQEPPRETSSGNGGGHRVWQRQKSPAASREPGRRAPPLKCCATGPATAYPLDLQFAEWVHLTRIRRGSGRPARQIPRHGGVCVEYPRSLRNAHIRGES